ncbi:OmpL47-type beta-barrel domain-containing protein [Paenibacillus humicola]|uniref:OmpL47-type beta-barrel domain-containing protein n=1 Tax=Paenibacillus humicola TaxID=3110540 RepID=UPI00237A6413|nr:hypothetical protein [Paenibacillus humicola]
MKWMKRASWIFLAIIALTGTISFVQGAAYAANEGGPLKSAQAIASNSGTAAVERGIIGHAAGSLPAKFQSASGSGYNVNPESDAAAAGDMKAGSGRVPQLPDGTGKKVLFDNTHGQTAGAADWVIDGGFSDFADGLRAAGFTVDQLDRTVPYTFGEQAVTYDKLRGYDVFIIGEANIPYKKSEQDAMLQYVRNGGSIFFIADHYNSDRNKNRWDASEVMNGYRRGGWDNPEKGMSAEEAASPAMQGVQSSDWLADNFGVRFRYNALGDVDNMTDVVAPDQAFGITAGVGSVAMHAGSTLAILDSAKAKGIVYPPAGVAPWANAVDSGVYDGGGRAEGPFAAVAKVGAGKAAFIGDSSPVEDATPKYLREDNGAKKTTYDGFKGEADDAVFLTRTVEWLADHESYTSLSEVPGLQLDAPTALLPSEDPTQSTEPQPEPWAAPDPGYKWYDPSTFKPGSYGSTQQPPVQALYKLVHQSVLPNAQPFQIRVTTDNLLPGQTVTGLRAGIYLDGGTQIAKFQNDDGSWPSAYGYSADFSLTADGSGHAYKDLNVQINPSASGPANLRLKAGSSNAVTEAVQTADVPAEPLPPDHPTVPETAPIAAARQAADGSLVTVEGVVTSEPGLFGGQGFYLQDDTAGIYVYQTQAGFHAGDWVTVSALKTLYNTEAELSDPVVLEKTGTASLPAPAAVQSISDANQGELVRLESVVIGNYTTTAPAGSFEFDAAGGAASTHVRIDGRTGIDYETFRSAFPEGSRVNITGIASIFGGVYQLKPLALADVAPADSEAPTTFVQTNGPAGEGVYNRGNVTLTFTARDNPASGGSGVARTEYSLNGGGWTAVQGPVTITDEGRNEVRFRSADAAGNVEDAQSVQIWIDKTAPSIGGPDDAAFLQTDAEIPVSESAADGFSGVRTVSYTLDGAPIASIVAIDPLALSAGPHTLVVTAEDNAGNTSAKTVRLTVGMDIGHLDELIGIGESKGRFADHGAAQSLLAKVNQLQHSPKDADSRLVRLADSIGRDAGKRIDADFAQLLLGDIAYIRKTGTE